MTILPSTLQTLHPLWHHPKRHPLDLAVVLALAATVVVAVAVAVVVAVAVAL